MKLGYVGMILVCIAVFALTSWITFKVNERRFHRRNGAGVEGFSSYRSAVVIRWTEWFVMVLARPTKWLAVGMGLSALLMLLRH
jgi:hypothetical protein